jgi:hypothetical protein
MWRAVLVEEGVPAMVRQGDAATFLGVSPYPTRVMVDEDYLERAREVLEAMRTDPSDEPLS